MNISELAVYTERCFRDDPSPCMVACPLGVDVVTMLDRCKKGQFAAAMRLYRNAVLFPAIVSKICPAYCEGVCVRNLHDRTLMIKEVEQAIVRLAPDARDSYRLPAKKQSVAVIGGGLSGAGCAIRLARRNYKVTLYEKEAQIGGVLEHTLSGAVVPEEMHQELVAVNCTLKFDSFISSLDELAEDAVYIATGQGGNDFDLLYLSKSIFTNRKGTFMGGMLNGSDPIHALAQGIQAAHYIEAFLKTGQIESANEKLQTIEINSHIYDLPVPPDPVIKFDRKEEGWIRQEASRCGGCRCSLCHDHCDMMQHFNRYPKRIVMDAVASHEPTVLSGRIGSRLVHSCSQCGLCGAVCPEDIDTGKAIASTRQHLFRTKAVPEAFHDHWLRDMEHAQGEDAYVAIAPPQPNEEAFLFFPGCQLGASDPRYVLETYQYLSRTLKNVGVVSGCCGIPALWAGDLDLAMRQQNRLADFWCLNGKPTILTACTNCHKTISEMSPPLPVRSVYELLSVEANAADCETRSKAAVFDPCNSRFDPSVWETVRSLAGACGVDIHELPHHKETAQCCGYGGHIYAANSDLTTNIAVKRSKASELPYITYCANCRDYLSAAGKTCRHILDVLFDFGDGQRRPPHLSQRRRNRERVKCELLELVYTPTAKREPRIVFDEDVLNKMDVLQVLEEEVENIVWEAEQTDCKIRAEEGRLVTRGSSGVKTCWVEYEDLEDGCYIRNVYVHRMSLSSKQVDRMCQ